MKHLDYIETVHRILKPNGVWLNFGPLTYHYEDSEEMSLELPFKEIVDIVEKFGFRIDKVFGRGELPSSNYTTNPDSMLQYTYYCGYFQCTKIDKSQSVS